MVRSLFAITLACAPVAAVLAQAQDYPRKPVQMIVSFGAGAGLDVVARHIGERLGQEWKTTVLVENRPGASGAIAAKAVANAAPDGYTLLATSQVHYTNTLLYKSLPYELSSFAAIARIGGTQLVVVVPATSRFDKLQGVLSFAKANPGKISYASLGNGSSAHMAGSLLGSMAGAEFLHVPYKEGSQALVQTISGEVAMNVVAITTAMAQVKAGKLKALGVTGATRSASMPDVPTVAESGLPGYDLIPWYVLLAPAGTPHAIIEKISTSVLKIARTPEFADVFKAQGLELMVDGSREITHKLPGEVAKWEKAVTATGLKLELGQ